MKKSAKPQIEPELLDVHRKTPRAKGGRYEKKNCVVLTPVEHQKEHGTYRQREEMMDKLKSLVDHRGQLLKLRNKINNQMLAFQRGTDVDAAETVGMLKEESERFSKMEKKAEGAIKKHVKAMDLAGDLLVRSAFGVRGLGEVTLASMMVYIDISKARHPSSLWKYAGYHCASHERYKKNEAGGGNKTLRCALFNFADSQIKTKGAYRQVYDNVKSRLEVSEKRTMTKVAGKVGAHEVMWKDASKGHRDGAARRAMAKHLLADYWYVARTIAGLDTNPTYAEAQLGMSHKTIDPEARGWVF